MGTYEIRGGPITYQYLMKKNKSQLAHLILEYIQILNKREHVKERKGVSTMKKILLQDIVIPKGTIFEVAPTKTERHGPGHIQTVIGLSNNTTGHLDYYVPDDVEEMREWFGDVE